MRAVIKSNGVAPSGAVRPLGLIGPARQPPEPWIDPEIMALREETARLREQLDRQAEEIAAYAPALERAWKGGEEAGRKAALKEAEDGRAERLAVIAAAANGALTEFTKSLAALELLAPDLAIAGLEKVLGPSEDRRRLMGDLINRQLNNLRHQAVLRVEVSSAEFDPGGVAELIRRLGDPPFEVVALDVLKQGDCRLALQLGGVEVGFGQQLGRLREVLQSLTRASE